MSEIEKKRKREKGQNIAHPCPIARDGIKNGFESAIRWTFTQWVSEWVTVSQDMGIRTDGNGAVHSLLLSVDWLTDMLIITGTVIYLSFFLSFFLIMMMREWNILQKRARDKLRKVTEISRLGNKRYIVNCNSSPVRNRKKKRGAMNATEKEGK